MGGLVHLQPVIARLLPVVLLAWLLVGIQRAWGALWTAIAVVLLTVLAFKVRGFLKRRQRKKDAEAQRAQLLPQMLERYDADRDGQTADGGEQCDAERARETHVA